MIPNSCRTLVHFCYKIWSIFVNKIPTFVIEGSRTRSVNRTDFNFSEVKAQKYNFSRKISRIFSFQNLKLVRLKSLTKGKALTSTIHSYDHKETPSMISRHSDCLGAALNAACFSNHKLHIFAVKSSKLPFFKQNLANFSIQI